MLARLVVLFAAALGTFALTALESEAGSASKSTAIQSEGRPAAFKVGAKNMYGLWYEDGCWHLKMVSKGTRVVFAGQVVVDGDKIVTRFEGLDKTRNVLTTDWVAPHANWQGFDFRFNNVGVIESVTFKVGPKAKTIRFKLLIGADNNPEDIVIGAKSVHPKSSTFELPAQP